MSSFESGKQIVSPIIAAALLGYGAVKLAEAPIASAAMPNVAAHSGDALAQNQTPDSTSEAGPIKLHDFQPLYNTLLPSQFNAVYYDLSLFLQNHIDPSVDEASISHLSDAKDG